MRKMSLIVLLFSAFLASGCVLVEEGAAPVTAVSEVQTIKTAEKADPETAIREIYSSLEEYSARVLDEAETEKIVGIPAAAQAEAFVNYSDAKSGLSDIMIVKPLEGRRDEIRENLYLYKESRIREFESYNILDAHTIAQNALVFDQGEYVILLMLKDNDAAKTIIDQYIPQ